VKLVVVTGTGTEVGKTWVAAGLLRLARQAGLAVAARKPLQSLDPGLGSSPAGPLGAGSSEGGSLGGSWGGGSSGGAASPPAGSDAAVLAAASGEDPDVVCPPERTYLVPMAPPMAAERLGRPVPSLASLAAGLGLPAGVDLAVVEGAGGVASPLAADGDAADLARLLGADVAVVVADPSLGVISSARLAARALQPVPVVVHLNRFEPTEELHRLNREWLASRCGLDVTTTIGELLEAVRP
jgi:dethiobiotin synthetase